MDLTFFRRAEQRFASHAPAMLEFGMLRATVAAQQAASPAARAQAAWSAMPRVEDPVAEILLAGAGWRRAVIAQGGCFNRALVRQRGVN
jgi:hypothetical protein